MRKRPSGKGIKRTPVEENEGERKFIKNQGNCSRGKCTGELACKELDNNYYTCVCPHDSKAPMPDGSCPRYTVPLQPGLIPNVLPPSKIQNNGKKNLTGNVLDDITPSVRHSTQPLNTEINFYIIIGSLLIFFTTIFLFSLILKRKYRLNRNDSTTIASPINLKTSIIPSKRYTPNPQYTACSGTGVPLLKKETLKFLHEIGEGCFGKVYKGEYTSECYNNKMEIVAIKVLKENATKEAEDDFLREVEIMSAFRHPNILSLIGVVTKDTNLNPMMVFEYMSYGDLAELLREQNSKNFNEKNLPPLTNLDILSISLQIAKGMSYLAAQRFVHRDLACRNCLVSEGPVVKIADFGMSRDVYTCDYYKIGGSRLLPVRWMSPESVIYGRFTLESDIWSFGVVLWEIYSFGKQPYYGHTNDEVVKLILTGIMLIPPNDCPTFICELMKNCWKTEPKDRMKFLNIVDKLNKEYENLKIQQINVNIEEEIIPKCFDRIKFNKTLPRPPPMSVIIGDEMDIEGYLLPKEMESVKYLETLPA